MPNEQAIKEAIDGVETPLVMVALSKGEVASKKTEIQAFTNGAGYYMITNLSKLHSLLDGKQLSPVEHASTKEISGDDFAKLDDLATMKSVPLDGTEVPELIGMDTELAFALAGEEVFCPISGKPTKFEYIGEVALDGEEGDDVLKKEVADDENDEDDAGDDASDDISDTDDSEMNADDDDGSDEDDEEETLSDDDVDFTGESDDGDEEDASEVADDNGGDFTIAGTETKALLDKYNGAVTVYESEDGEAALYGAVVRVLNADTFVVIDDEGNPYTIKATTIADDGDAVKLVGSMQSTDTASEQEVLAAETVELEDNQVRLLNTTGDASNSEVAVFVGSTHIATLHKSRASETAAPLFANGTNLFQAFRPTLQNHYHNQKSPELAKFGYVPVSFKVKAHKLFDQRLKAEVAKASTVSEVASATKVGDFAANLEIAFVGINKGMFDTKNALIAEVASLLRRNGVVNAEVEVRKVFSKHATSYSKAAVEKAKELNGKSADYLNGLSETLTKAEFAGAVETASVETLSTAFLEERSKPAPKPEIAGFSEPQTTSANRFDKVIAGIGRRR